MKTHIVESGVQFFFHRYLINAQKFNPQKRPKFQNEEDISLSSTNFTDTRTSLHKCRLVKVGQENLEEWPLYLLKRMAYMVQKKKKKGKSYQMFDQNIKKLSQIRTEYLCYQILNKSHRVVRLIEMINENPKKQDDQKFFYKFLGRKKQQGVQNVCFILELCNNGTLDQRITNFKNPLSQDQIIMYSSQVLQGLVELKKKGILHRDLRPCNIFLQNDEVKFGDFDSAFIYKESQCSDIKSGIDINTTPQQIVELASMSDEELEAIGNLKLFELQSKCDIYFFGMLIFKMIFKRDYEKKFQGTDIDYLIRQKNKEGFSCPKLLEIMKRCLYTNVQKRIDLPTLYDEMKFIQKERYFTSVDKQRTYLSEDPLNLFNYKALDPVEPEIVTEIENSINQTFTLSFESVEYDFEKDFQKAALNRATKLYVDEVHRAHSKFYKTHQNSSLWTNNLQKRKQHDKFVQIMEDFVIQMSTRAYYYDYLYTVILKINTKSISKKQQKTIVVSNKHLIEKELIIVLKFLFEILSRTPFKIDKYYDEKSLPYETRKLFRDKIKINSKYNFFHGRAKTFNFEDFDTYKIISQFYNIEYEEIDSDNFQTIYDNVLYMISNIDSRMKKMLSQGIVDLFRPYESSRKAKNSHLKEILFIMITLEKQKLSQIKKSNIVMMKTLLEPLFSGSVVLDSDEAQSFFDNYKKLHMKEVEESKRKENIQLSYNLLSVSKKHLDCLAAFMAPFALAKPLAQPMQQIQENEENYERGSTKERKSVKFSAEQQINQDKDKHEELEQDTKSPQKEQIQVQVLEDSHFSEFNDNLENSHNPILA